MTGKSVPSIVAQLLLGSCLGSALTLAAQSPSLTSIQVTAPSGAVAAGSSLQFAATGSYSDGSSQDLTGAVLWNSSNPASLTVNSAGVGLGLAPGAAIVRASSGSVQGSMVATVVASSVQGWWPFDDASGSTAADVSGHADSAVLFNGVAWSAGRIGGAVSADGSNQYVGLPAIDLSATRAVTWTAWVNRSYGSGSGVLLENTADYNASTTGFGVFPDDNADCGAPNTMMLGVRGDVGYTVNCYRQPSSGAWHHLAAVYDKSQAGPKVIALYVDGVLQIPVSQPYTTTNGNTFGNSSSYLFSRGGVSNFAAGSMDDLRLYASALSPSQIYEIYLEGLGTLSSILVSPSGATLRTGSVLQYQATGTYSSGTALDLTRSVNWSSSDAMVATINASGTASGVAAGTATIRAVAGAVAGSTSLIVQNGPALLSLSMAPANPSVLTGGLQQLTVTGTYSDGSTQVLTDAAVWTSGDNSIATVSPSGLVKGVAAGDVGITAQVGSLSASATVSVVSAPTLVGWWQLDDGSGDTAIDSSGNGNTASLFNSPAWVPGEMGDGLSANGTSQYVAIPAVDLSGTKAVTWAAWVNRSYGSGSGALMENSDNFNLTTSGFGLFPDDAADCGAPNTMMAGLKGDAGYALSCYAQPSSGVWHHIAVIYDKTQLGTKAISLFLDGVLQAPLRQPYAVTNSNGFGANSTYLYSRGGNSNFAAGILDDVRLYNVALTPAQIQQIYAPGLGPLQSIAVSPANATLDAGLPLSFQALGTYRNGTTLDLTSQVTWQSSLPGVATISASGVASGVSAGVTTILAAAGSVTGSTALTVRNGPSLVAIAVTPTPLSVVPGASQQITAVATFSDGSTQDVTKVVAWSSSNSSVAAVNSSGLMTASAEGSTSITATLGSVSGSAAVSVVAINHLVGWWQFDDGSGTVAADSSAGDDPATLTGGVNWVAGRIGDAVSANGNGQFLSIASVNPGATQAVSWTAWVKRAYGSGSGALLESSSNFNLSSTGFGFFPDDSADCGAPSTLMTGFHGDVGYALNCYAQPTSGVWHHLAAVYDKTQSGSNAVSLYLDGVLQTPVRQLSASANTNGFAANPLYLFSRGGASNFAAGALDDLRFYNMALSAAQIQDIYQQGLGALQSIALTPTGASLAAGTALQYIATATYSSGVSLNVTSAAQWSSSTPAVASITASGLAIGVGAGSTQITATYGGISGSTGLSVQNGAGLVSIAVLPATFSLAPGGTQQLQVQGSYSDGSTEDLTAQVQWTSSNDAVAAVSAAGLVSAAAEGSATIEASLGSLAASARVSVMAMPYLVGWWKFDEGAGSTASDSSGNANTASLANGMTWMPAQIGDAVAANGINQFAAIPAIDLSTTSAVTWTAWVNRTYGAGSGVLLENTSNFNSAMTGFGFFPDDAADCGAASAMMAGIHGNVGYTENCYAQPTSGVWHHLAVVYDKSQAGASAIALYIDGVLQTPTRQLYTATNTNSFGNSPTYLFARGGTSNFAAGAIDDLRIYDEALGASQIKQIYLDGLGSLLNLSVTPANVTVGPGAAQQYLATGSFNKGPAQDLSAFANWSSSNPAVAGIGAGGLASALSPGTTTIQATYGSQSGSTQLTVSASSPTLLSIAVTPASFLLYPGQTMQLAAIGTYSDGSTQDLTGTVVWSSASSSVLTVSPSGLAQGIAVGSASVTAANASISGTANGSVLAKAGGFVQWTSGDSGSTLTSTTRQDQAARSGNLVLVFSHWDNQAASATVTDQVGNTYIPIFAPTNVGASDRFQIWYARNIQGGVGLLVTVTYSGRTNSISTVDVLEYAGLDTVSPLDGYVSATGFGNTQSTGPMPSTTHPNDTILGLFGYTGAGTPYLAGSGFSFRNYDATTMLEDMAVTSVGSYTATASSSTPTGWAAFGIALKNQPPPPGLTLHPATVTAGTSSTASIALSAPAPAGGAVLTLVSSQPAIAAVPPTVTIPDGQTSATFLITTGAVTFTSQAEIYAQGTSTASAILTVVPVSMAQIASDSFNRPNASTLGPNWTPLLGAGANVALQVVNGYVEDGKPNDLGKEMFYGGFNWTPDQYSQAQIVTAAGGGNEGPAVRMSSNDTHYACLVYNVGTGSASVAIVLDHAAVYTTLASTANATVANGDIIRCTVQGAKLTMTNVTTGTTLLTANDATIPSGYPGLIIAAGGSIADYVMANWSGGANMASLTPVQMANDSFARADAIGLGPKWVVGAGHGPIQIVNQQVQPYPAGGIQPSKQHFVAAGPFPDDQWSRLQVAFEDTIGDIAVELRASDSADTMYVADVNITGTPGTAETRIVKVLNGTISTLITDQQWSAVSPGDYIRGQVQGSLISLIDDTTGTLLLATFDTSVTSGYPGISMQAVTGTASDHIAANWSAGDFQ